MTLRYKTLSTPKCEKTHRKKIDEIKLDNTIDIEEIRTLYAVENGQIVWKSRILYRNKNDEANEEINNER